MAFWNEFLQGTMPYQEYWMPLGIGLAAGMLCLFTGNWIWRARRSTAAPQTAPAAPAAAAVQHDPFEKGSLTDKRRSLRRPGNPVEILYALPEHTKSPHRALVLDRSLGGLRLATAEPIEPGTRLQVLPVSAVDQFPWIDIDVKTCAAVEDSWELGCQFIKTPQWSILLMFG